MIDSDTIMDVLREIPDPEMPISIVDLGLVENIRVESNGDFILREMGEDSSGPGFDGV